MTGTRRIVISAVVLAAASAVLGVIALASQPMSSAMSGMDHGSAVAPEGSHTTADPGDMAGMDMSGSSPAPTNPAEVPMDMEGMDMSGASPAPTDHGEMPGMDMPGMESGSGDAHGATSGHGSETEAAADRPLAPVLGTFGGGSAAVLLGAGFLRRKDRAASIAKKAARTAGRSRK